MINTLNECEKLMYSSFKLEKGGVLEIRGFTHVFSIYFVKNGK
jgi:hypothetical protein